MPTPSEQKALAFVAIVVLLGGAVRVLRAGSAAPTQNEQQGIAHQAHAADSAAHAAAAGKTKGKGRARKPRAGDTVPNVIGGVTSVTSSPSRLTQPMSPFGYPPPGPRIDVDYRSKVSAPAPVGGVSSVLATIDINHASVAEIEKLPRVGPTMARRIAANRDSLGPFADLQALHRVKGMGPKTVQQLAPLIRFGAQP